MDKEKLEELLIDYIDGLLDEQEKATIQHKLTHDREAQLLYGQLKELMVVMDAHRDLEPRPVLRQRFHDLLASEARRARRIRQSSPMVYRIAAAIALVLTGIGIGYWISWQQKQKSEMQALRREIRETRSIVMDKLRNEQSAGQRILGVRATSVLDRADSAVTSALIRLMNRDPNANVRLAAIEALKRYHHEPAVRLALISSLSTQTDPVVQIALIHLMVEMRERQAIEPLREITTDVSTLQAVRDEAYAGIFSLSRAS